MSTSTRPASLRHVLQTAAARAGLTSPASVFTGLPAPAKALFVAATAPRGTVTLLVVPADRDVEQMTADARFFLEALEDLPESGAEQAILPFPSDDGDPYRGIAAHLYVISSRALALHALATGAARTVIASAASLLPRLSQPARLLRASLALSAGTELTPTALGDLLLDAGFSREDPVDEHGEYCVRGGVVDLFPAGDVRPLRVEFSGDTVESIRRFDPTTQRSIEAVDRVVVVPLRERFPARPGAGSAGGEDRSADVFDYLACAAGPRLVMAEAEAVRTEGTRYADRVDASWAEAERRGSVCPPVSAWCLPWAEVDGRLEGAVRLEELGLDEPDAGADGPAHVACQPSMEFRGRIADWVADVGRSRARGETVLFVAETPGRAERTVELLSEYGVPAVAIDWDEPTEAGAVLVAIGSLTRGFGLPAAALQIVAEADVFEEERRPRARRRSLARTFMSDFRDLKVGDLVVHVDHGIGRFVGLKQIAVDGESQEFMELRYATDDKLFVPVERLDLVQKYTGSGHPALDRLGGASWERAKSKVRKAVRDLAEELLRLYAARRVMTGHAFSPDTHWQQEFEDTFAYELTADQQTATADIKSDMETAGPMDRLLCGDVGYGKTEVAMRAAFKAVMDSKQVALLAPTTVLAFQHVKTLRERLAGFPINVDMISRFRTRQEQAEVLANLAAGRVDIIVGTHRLLSRDVQFRDLGLLIVDEEQRFGVAHKERIKQLRRRVDVLTMTATPIPRTLNMSLVGIRDMSIIETPPKDRLAIQTHVAKFDRELVARAIRGELARGGQVYFVHNRVESIYSMAALLSRLVPEARLAVAHGQMSETALERVMVEFVDRRHDVLLATTIIENGLDIPNVNTILVNRADRCGLAQLYQLRGRVGRSDRRAYAYLLVPPEEALSGVAKKRLAAIREFSELGSGFRVAALDLEIRGAGNLLGGEQSGHIEAIGFHLYMKLLEQTVRELRGEEIEKDVRTTVNLGVDLRIGEDYIPDMTQRLALYRRVAAARSDAEIEQILDEVRDRYGPLPAPALNLAWYGRIRLLASGIGIESIERDGQTVILRFRSEPKVDPAVLVTLVRRRADLKLAPPGAIKLALPSSGEPFHAQTAAPARPGAGLSWWTLRASEDEVRPGFTREALLRPPRQEPRAAGGVFDRVGRLLAELSETVQSP